MVRLMVEDHEDQARSARRLLEQTSERDEPVFISDIVLSEIEWVLESAYSVPRRRILAALNALVSDERYVFADRERVTTALDLYGRGKGDLADYLLGLDGEAAGARKTFTFDRALRDDARFAMVPK